jgi:hypothetical protein
MLTQKAYIDYLEILVMSLLDGSPDWYEIPAIIAPDTTFTVLNVRQEIAAQRDLGGAEPLPVLASDPVLSDSYHQAARKDASVASMAASGCSTFDIIGSLVYQKSQLIQRIMELESIAPRRITLPDGTEVIWRCPDELVP